MYASPNFKSKKALKAAVSGLAAGEITCIPRAFSPGPFPCPENGRVSIEGPHSPAPHTWYAQVLVEDGVIVKVIS